MSRRRSLGRIMSDALATVAPNSMVNAYQFHSIESSGRWTSEPFPAAERRHIVQGVIAGFLFGHPRWATTLDGVFIYGLDAAGNEIRVAP